MALYQIGPIEFQLLRKPIKNLHISVLPPDGKIRVSAPENMTDTAIRMAVVSRIPWIKQQQSDFANQPRQSDREMVNGECHYLWGRRHRLEVIERTGRHEVSTRPGKFCLYVHPDTTQEKRARLLNEFYRAEVKRSITAIIGRWQTTIGVSTSHWGVKKMKTKWGSCNTDTGRIWLNLELAKKPPECLEYILVHELVHLIERRHNERFKALMDSHMGNWRERRDLLNQLPLAFEHWRY